MESRPQIKKTKNKIIKMIHFKYHGVIIESHLGLLSSHKGEWRATMSSSFYFSINNKITTIYFYCIKIKILSLPLIVWFNNAITGIEPFAIWLAFVPLFSCNSWPSLLRDRKPLHVLSVKVSRYYVQVSTYISNWYIMEQTKILGGNWREVFV